MQAALVVTNLNLMVLVTIKYEGFRILDLSVILPSIATALRLFLPLIALISFSASALDIRNSHCFAGCPEGNDPENRLIIRPIYTLSYNEQTKVADWAAYTVSVDSIGIASNLSRAPVPDNFLLDTLTLIDYATDSGATFLYGQLVPLLNFAGTPFWQDTNYFSNGIPISKSLNTGAWYGLDWSIRNLVNRVGQVFVIAGPIYFEQPQAVKLDTNKTHQVPDAFFKVVIGENGDSSAFILNQQSPVHAHHCNLVSTLEEVEELTGLTLIPDSIKPVRNNLHAVLGCS
jgi:endonuclease G, mitochondrial